MVNTSSTNGWTPRRALWQGGGEMAHVSNNGLAQPGENYASRLGVSKFRAWTLEERTPVFWGFVAKAAADECWEWRGLRKKAGYGKFSWGGKLGLAHRFAWIVTHGPIPEGMFVCHHCDNPPCCNPAHLFVGTRADNSNDMWSKGRHPICRTTAKLSDDQVLEILASDEPQGILAARYHIDRSSISRVRSRETYTHVNSGHRNSEERVGGISH